jgi:ribonuclease HI
VTPGAVRPRKVVVYTDGAARGNPGPAGAGVCIRRPSGRLLTERGRYLGETTNNVAEYQALLLGLEEAARLGASDVELRSDSELLVRQMRGEYRVRNPALRELHSRAQSLEAAFNRVDYVHVPREKNADADRLANRAIDAAKRASDEGLGGAAGNNL